MKKTEKRVNFHINESKKNPNESKFQKLQKWMKKTLKG